MPSLRLADLPDARNARVEAVVGPGLLRERLVELGFVAGAEVEVLRRAPFSGPLQVRVRGGSLALRIDEAACVEVAVSAGSDGGRCAPAGAAA